MNLAESQHTSQSKLVINIFDLLIDDTLEEDGFLEPIEDPKSNCYGCEAGMCSHDICRGDQYHYSVDTLSYDDVY